MKNLSLLLGTLLALSGITAVGQEVLADIRVESATPGNAITFQADGNITLDGKCYGNVPTAPSGATVSFFGTQAVAKNGNLYFQGAVNFSSVSFPGDVVASDSSALASFTSAGTFFLKGKCLNSAGCSNTLWQPTVWNDGGTVQFGNNCYNYGNDKITGTFAQPGKATGNQVQWPPTVATTKAAAISDGLTFVGDTFPGNTYDCGNGHLVFMAIWPGYDYHWWRLDQTNGSWTHKPGGTQATNLDSSNNPISNPLLANRGGYTTPGGFFCTCGGLANIQ
jgi:hypothetical protein